MNSSTRDNIILIHIAGVLLTVMIFTPLFERSDSTLLYLMLGAISVILLNMYNSAYTEIVETYMEESRVMALVESNARSVLPFVISIAIFSTNLNADILQDKDVRYTIVVTSALFSLCLLLIWTPRGNAIYARYLRDIKNILLTIGLFMTIALTIGLVTTGITA